MAKSSKPEESSDRAPRIGRYTPERLQALAKELSDRAAQIRGLAKAMSDSEIKSLNVDGHSGALGALTKIDNFIGHALRGIKAHSNKRLWNEAGEWIKDEPS